MRAPPADQAAGAAQPAPSLSRGRSPGSNLERVTDRVSSTPFGFIASLAVVAVVGLCCVLPLGWMLWQVGSNPGTLRGLVPDAFHLRLLARTLFYNGSVAVIATLLALPAALVLGRGRGKVAAALWFALPVALLMPSLAYAYGWSQVVRMAGLRLVPGGAGDVARCVLTLAAWLWPLPAGLLGVALRRVDVNLQQQALLDGAL